MKTIDARGLACPEPVVLTNKALAEANEVTTIVDNEVAVENLKRLAATRGCVVELRAEAGIFQVLMRRTPGDATQPAQTSTATADRPAAGQTVLFVAGDAIGQGSEELGQLLARTFFHTLGERPEPVAAIVFMNAGVKLVVTGSPVLEDLRALATQGVELLACGTCLGFYELKDKLAVGRISNMYELSETLLGAGKVIRL